MHLRRVIYAGVQQTWLARKCCTVNEAGAEPWERRNGRSRGEIARNKAMSVAKAY